METRKILIANNKTQQRYEIMTNATTLGELQDQMTAQGIDFTGMTFTEGISKTQLLNRESLLPTNVMYKGQPTNDLVMLLTNTTKQISSGALSRKDLYAAVKRLGLQNVIKAKYGKNFTMVGNRELEEEVTGRDIDAEIFNNISDELERQGVIEEVHEELSQGKAKTPRVTAPHDDLVELMYLGVKYMVNHNLMFPDDAAVLGDLVSELAARKKEEQPKISDADVNEMFASL